MNAFLSTPKQSTLYILNSTRLHEYCICKLYFARFIWLLAWFVHMVQLKAIPWKQYTKLEREKCVPRFFMYIIREKLRVVQSSLLLWCVLRKYERSWISTFPIGFPLVFHSIACNACATWIAPSFAVSDQKSRQPTWTATYFRWIFYSELRSSLFRYNYNKSNIKLAKIKRARQWFVIV